MCVDVCVRAHVWVGKGGRGGGEERGWMGRPRCARPHPRTPPPPLAPPLPVPPRPPPAPPRHRAALFPASPPLPARLQFWQDRAPPPAARGHKPPPPTPPPYPYPPLPPTPSPLSLLPLGSGRGLPPHTPALMPPRTNPLLSVFFLFARTRARAPRHRATPTPPSGPPRDPRRAVPGRRTLAFVCVCNLKHTKNPSRGNDTGLRPHSSLSLVNTCTSHGHARAHTHARSLPHTAVCVGEKGCCCCCCCRCCCADKKHKV